MADILFPGGDMLNTDKYIRFNRTFNKAYTELYVSFLWTASQRNISLLSRDFQCEAKHGILCDVSVIGNARGGTGDNWDYRCYGNTQAQ